MTHSAALEKEVYSRTVFGFWVYLMTDCILFSTLFATYGVLHNNTYGGPSGHDLFHASYALGETLVLLFSSFICGLARLAAFRGSKGIVLGWFSCVFLLGATFLTMEALEFTHLVQSGNSWERSGFLSSFFTLVGTHGLHITTGLLWLIFLMVQIASQGITPLTFKRLTCFSLFWHFLDVVWIFIFTVVYLSGVA